MSRLVVTRVSFTTTATIKTVNNILVHKLPLIEARVVNMCQNSHFGIEEKENLGET